MQPLGIDIGDHWGKDWSHVPDLRYAAVFSSTSRQQC